MIRDLLFLLFGSNDGKPSNDASIKVGNVYEQNGGSAIVEVSDISHDGKVIHYKFLPANPLDKECVLSVTQFKAMYVKL